MADLLLELISATARLHVLMAEASPAETAAAQPRLKAFVDLVGDLPAKKSTQRLGVMGFTAASKKAKK